MADNGAGQDGGWLERGMRARTGLAETWTSLAEACHELSGNEWALPTECPGWDVKDQLSHLIGIERTLLGDARPEWDAPLGDHVKNDFGALNEPWVAVRRSQPALAVYAEFVEVTETRLGRLDQCTEEDWAAVGWSPVGEVPYARFMEVRVFDSWAHEQDVRRALDRPGGSANLASDMALGHMESVMPFVVGKKAACPDGTVVRFDVSGPGDDARAFTIAVEGGRAKPVGDGDATPTVTLAMSSIDFLRLGCGRATADQVEAAGGIRIAGDAATGQNILHNMNFMM